MAAVTVVEKMTSMSPRVYNVALQCLDVGAAFASQKLPDPTRPDYGRMAREVGLKHACLTDTSY